jgi:hypothetical protein
LVQHLASTVPSEKDVDMEEALASFIRDGIDPVTALRRPPGRIIESI